MPSFARDALGAGVKILLADGGIAGHGGRSGTVAADMDMRFAKIAYKPLMRGEIDLLVAEEDNAMGDDGVVHLLHLPVAQRPGQVDTANFGADIRRRSGDGNGVVAH